ncbi:MAG: efflux RND transporter periplasmic adaptor subunit [Chloroflexi bacterium]|nr:efflux RND transporter periplasmic adaptor subunit [Chloroflexota bacterium]
MTTETNSTKGKVRKRLALVLLTLLVGAALLVAYSLTSKPVAQASPPPETTAVPIEAAAIPVQVAAVQTGDMAQVFYYAGVLQAKDEVNLAPRISGRIESVLVEVGDEVKAGNPIAVIESDLYTTQLEQAEAALTIAQLKLAKMEEGSRPEELNAAQSSVEVAQAALNDATNISDDERNTAAADMAKAQAALRRAQSEYDKIAWAGQVGETPQAIQLEQATIAYETALSAYNLKTNPTEAQLAPLKAQLVQAQLSLNLARNPFRPVDFDMARAGVKQAEAAVAQARIQSQDTTLKAPFDGLVAKVNVRKGSMVKPETAVIQLVSKDLEVLVNVEESRIAQLAEGQNASLRIVAYPGQEFPALVSSVAPAADTNTFTFAVKVTPLDKTELRRSGMYADVSILVNEKLDALLAPRAAVTLIGNQETVFVVQANNTVQQRRVTTGLVNGDRIEILSGLKPGEAVVIAGQPNLTDGARVKVETGL